MSRTILILVLFWVMTNVVLAKNSPGMWLEKQLNLAGLSKGEPLEVSAMKPAREPHLLSNFCLKMARQQKAEDGRAALVRAYYLIKMGSHYEALEHLGRAILEAPESKAPHALRVVCYASLGMRNAVVAGLERCLKIEPKDPISRVRLCRALLHRKKGSDLKRAFAIAKELVEAEPQLNFEFARSFPQGTAQIYFEERCADLRVEKAIAQLRTIRPTLCPPYFRKSPNVLQADTATKTAQQPAPNQQPKAQEQAVVSKGAN